MIIMVMVMTVCNDELELIDGRGILLVARNDLDMKDAYHLDGGRPRDGRKNRRKDQRADHQRHRRRVKTGCQQLCGHLAIRDRDASGQHHCEARALGQRVNRPVNQGAIGFLHVGPVL